MTTIRGQEKSHRFSIVIQVLVGLILILLVSIVYYLARINIWSVQMLHARMGGDQIIIEPPSGHRRSALWQAQDALKAGDERTARFLLEPLVERGDPLALSVYGQALALQGERARAVQAWQEVGDFNSLQASAVSWAAEGFATEAELAFRAAYDVLPERIVNPYVDFLYRTNKSKAGEELLREALNRFPRSHYRPQWQERLGNHLRIEGRLVDAIDTFRQALDENPDTIYLLSGLGRAYADQGERELAVEQFQRATSLYPEEGDGYYEMGLLLANEERYAEAEEYLSEGMQLESQRLGYCLGRGNVALRANNLPLAIEVYKICTQRFPQDGRAYEGRAWALYQSGRLDEAREDIERALELPPGAGAARWILAGMIYDGIGIRDQAQTAYEMALMIDPQNRVAQSALDRLSQP